MKLNKKLTKQSLRKAILQEMGTTSAKRKKGEPKDQYLYGTDVANSEDEVARHDAWAGGDNLNDPIAWEKVLDMIKEEMGMVEACGGYDGRKEALPHIVMDDIHEVPDDLESLDPHDAYGLGHEAGTEHAEEDGNDTMAYKPRDREGRMTKAHLYHMMKYATGLYDMIDDDDNLPEWMQSKIARAVEKLSSAYHYMDSQENQPESIGHM